MFVSVLRDFSRSVFISEISSWFAALIADMRSAFIMVGLGLSDGVLGSNRATLSRTEGEV